MNVLIALAMGSCRMPLDDHVPEDYDAWAACRSAYSDHSGRWAELCTEEPNGYEFESLLVWRPERYVSIS